MTNNRFYIVSLGGAAGVFYIHCTSKQAVKREIENNSDGYFRLTIWEMIDDETPSRRCNPDEF